MILGASSLCQDQKLSYKFHALLSCRKQKRHMEHTPQQTRPFIQAGACP